MRPPAIVDGKLSVDLEILAQSLAKLPPGSTWFGSMTDEEMGIFLARVAELRKAYHPSELPEHLKTAIRHARMHERHERLNELLERLSED